jgi:NAD(P)-dependent dehydrogenase (short-subunit alcohol dehydrogenase family)
MKKALITGASRGIGRAIAKALSDDKFEVFINYVGNVERAEEAKREIEESGGKCTLVKVDLCSPDCAEECYKITGDIDVLVLNASIQYRNKWDSITLDEFDTQVNCNFRSSFLLIQKYAPYMQKNRWGRIITIGSVQEKKPHPDMLIYSSTKAAVTLMAQSLSLRLADSGVTVNSVAPGVIVTDRNSKALEDEEYAKQVKENIPAGYFGDPEACAGIISFLCSDKAHYITGQNIFVDGGMGIK